VKRRDFLAGAAGAFALPGAALAQVDPLDPLVWVVTNGAPVRKGRVTLVLPQLADNGNSVPIRITVDSPMTAADHVKSIHLFAEKNHLPRILEVQLGSYNGKAMVSSRVRVATSQQLTAVAVLSDGSLWSAAADIEVVTSECGL